MGFHIHEKGSCAADGDAAFTSTGGHYDPKGVPHPTHAGDLPSLLSSANGTALAAIFSDRFPPSDIFHRAVIIHGMADDLHSQPVGDSGARIACGVILPA